MNNRRFDGGALLHLCYSAASSHPSKPLGKHDPCQPLRLPSRDPSAASRRRTHQPAASCQTVSSQSICAPKLGDPSYTAHAKCPRTDSLISKPTCCCCCAHATSACKHRTHHHAGSLLRSSQTISPSIRGHVCYQPFGSWRHCHFHADFLFSARIRIGNRGRDYWPSPLLCCAASQFW